MKRLLILTSLLILACASQPAMTQIFSGPNHEQRARKAGKREQKQNAKRNKKQIKQWKKFEKSQKKATRRKH
jgi:hypothetical protein